MNHQRLIEKTFVGSVKWFHQLESTNTFVLQQIDQLLREEQLPLLVGANVQTAGRGRGANVWWANDGALTFSLLLAPQTLNVKKEQWPLLSLTVGLSVCLSLNRCVPEQSFQLKWPNDVYVSGKKICGVLVETLPDQPEMLVIGVGLNMNNSLCDAPAEIQQRATSLVDLTDKNQDPDGLLEEFLNELQDRLQELSKHSEALACAWKTHCYLTGKSISITNGSDVTEGRCQGIDSDGALRLQTSTGEQRYFAGIVSLGD